MSEAPWINLRTSFGFVTPAKLVSTKVKDDWNEYLYRWTFENDEVVREILIHYPYDTLVESYSISLNLIPTLS